MNLFLVQLSPTGCASERRLADALAGLRAEIPFLSSAETTAWLAPSGRIALASAADPPGRTGGVRYVVTEPRRAALFSGRPFLWTDEFETDGRSPLAPSFYLAPATQWIDRLDGRWAAVRCDDARGELEVCTDPLGSYPLYTGRSGGDRWFSNSPELIRRLVGSEESRVSVLASFLACGAALDGVPRWEGVDRLPAGVQRYGAGDGRRRGPDAIDWLSLLGEAFDAEVAARRLAAVVRALADWPGRPAFVSLSGGRDSRLVLAAALAADADIRPRTMSIPGEHGYPNTRDVVVSRLLCAQAGLSHELIAPEAVYPAEQLARLLAVLSPGASSLELAAQAALGRRLPAPPAPRELVVTGHCGELARAYYGSFGDDARDVHEAVARRLAARTMPAIPRPLLSPAARDSYRGAIDAWVARQQEAGAGPELLLDLFYLDQRMPHWIAVSQSVSEYLHDLTNPLWSRRLIPQELALAPEQRQRELFHLEVIRALAPALLEVPFNVEAFGGPRRGKSMSAGPAARTAKVRRELRRSIRGFPGIDVLPEVAAAVKSAAALDEAHPAWEVLDRQRVRRLLARNPHRLDRRSRSQLWRLATVLLVPERPNVRAARVCGEAVTSPQRDVPVRATTDA